MSVHNAIVVENAGQTGTAGFHQRFGKTESQALCSAGYDVDFPREIRELSMLGVVGVGVLARELLVYEPNCCGVLYADSWRLGERSARKAVGGERCHDIYYEEVRCKSRHGQEGKMEVRSRAGWLRAERVPQVNIQLGILGE